MQTLDSALSNTTGTHFQTTVPGDAWFKLSGTFAGTIALHASTDNSTFAAFAADGTAVTFTAAGTHKYALPGGLFFRFVSTNAGDSVNIRVQGHVTTKNLN